MASIEPEESFAPEVSSEDEAPAPPPKRFCKGNPQATSQQKALEKDALVRIIEFDWSNKDDEDSDNENDIQTSSTDKLQERIRYLQLDLANAKLEIEELKEQNAKLKQSDDALKEFENFCSTVKANNRIYQDLAMQVNHCSFVDLIRSESTRIQKLPTIHFSSLPQSLQVIMFPRATELEDQQQRARDEFHNRILWEKSKANTLTLLRISALGALIFMIFFLLIRIVL
jgi:hypothetical protein